MFCTGATFATKNSCVIARIVSFDTVGLILLTFCISEPNPPKILHLISVALSQISDIIVVLFKLKIKHF